MWTLKRGRVGRAIFAGAIAAFALMTASPSRAVEYVRICPDGSSFYEPGSDICLDPNQIVANQFAIAKLATQAATGTAMAGSLVNPWLPDNTNYAISLHWATFDGQNAFGFAGLRRIKGNLALSAGLSVGLDNGSLRSLTNREEIPGFPTSVQSQSWSNLIFLGRLGLEYSW